MLPNPPNQTTAIPQALDPKDALDDSLGSPHSWFEVIEPLRSICMSCGQHVFKSSSKNKKAEYVLGIVSGCAKLL